MNRLEICAARCGAYCSPAAGCDGGSTDTTAAVEDTAAADMAMAEEEWRQPLFEGLGDVRFPVTTTSDDAQAYFNQGLALAWAFNHAASDLAFNEAALADPDCAMCLWGSALALGPNVNAEMDPMNAPRARLATRARTRDGGRRSSRR